VLSDGSDTAGARLVESFAVVSVLVVSAVVVSKVGVPLLGIVPGMVLLDGSVPIAFAPVTRVSCVPPVNVVPSVMNSLLTDVTVSGRCGAARLPPHSPHVVDAMKEMKFRAV
jgi:hypothetical protein